jgi:vanillate O-demethylase monooxygenase subunit
VSADRPDNYPRNCWFVAATSSEVVTAPLGRRLLGEDVVLWRSAGGRLIAFENRCAHRAFPLSHSVIDGEHLICGYHGCTYDSDGACTHIPSQERVPSGMRVRTFPILEDPPFVWIWMGSPGAAALSSPPHVPWIREPGWTSFYSAWDVAANYLMVHEHYLDFSYATILHGADIPEAIRSMPAFSEVEVSETTVSYTRVLPPARPTDWEADAGGLDRTVEYRRQEMGTFASPALHLHQWDLETPAAEVLTTTRLHALTPESETSTHVFMAGSRNYAPGSAVVTEVLRSFLDGVAGRDVAVLEAVSAHSGYQRWQTGVEFQADVAALHARRIVGVMLSNEAGPARIRGRRAGRD